MKTKKYVSLILAVVFVAAVFAGCGNTVSNPESPRTAVGRIGASQNIWHSRQTERNNSAIKAFDSDESNENSTITLRISSLSEIYVAMYDDVDWPAKYPGYTHYIFILTQSVYINDWTTYLYVHDSNQTVTITGEHSGIAIKRGNISGPMLNLSGNITLKNITIDGSLPNNIKSYGSIITNEGTLVLEKGAVVKNNTLGALPDYYKDTRVNDDYGIYIYGGAIYNSGTLIMKENAEISGIDGYAYGTIYNEGTLVMSDNSKIQNCKAMFGGGIVNGGGDVTVKDNAAIKNNSASSGGGILNAKGKVTVTGNAIIENNYTNTYGGGINNNDDLYVSGNAAIKNNTATFGGGIFNAGTAEMTGHSTIHGNTATPYSMHYPDFGGGGLKNSGTFVMKGCASIENNQSIGGNTADGIIVTGGTGGGVQITTGIFTMQDESKISGNYADGLGGGIYINTKTATIKDNAQVINNSAGEAGGGAYILSGTLYLAETAGITGNQAPENPDIFGTPDIYEEKPESRPKPEPQPEPQQPQPQPEPEPMPEFESETNITGRYLIIAVICFAVLLTGAAGLILINKSKKRKSGENKDDTETASLQNAEAGTPTKETAILMAWNRFTQGIKSLFRKISAWIKALCARVARGILAWATNEKGSKDSGDKNQQTKKTEKTKESRKANKDLKKEKEITVSKK